MSADKTVKKKLGAATQQLYEIGKLQPQAVDLEQALLGALMLDPDSLSATIDILKPESFYKEQHQMIFCAILNLFEHSSPVDILTVTNELKKSQQLEIVGGAYYISQLTNRVASGANSEFHARIIAQKFIQREIIRIATDGIKVAYDDVDDVFDMLNELEQNLYSIIEDNIKKSYDKMHVLLGNAIKEIEKAREQKSGVTGVQSGFTALDRVTAGWQKSDLIIIAARPAMGKCLGKGTKVLMYDGTLKNVEDVIIGDQLMGDDSTPRNVISLSRGREMMYWIRQTQGVDYRVNESHILSLKSSGAGWGRAHGEVLNISVKEYLMKSEKFQIRHKGYKTDIDFKEKPLPIHPYYLGLWLGDGSKAKAEITNPDIEIISYLRKYAKEIGLQTTENDTGKRCHSTSITKGYHGNKNDMSLIGELRKINVFKNKHVPSDYLTNSSKNRLELLAGLLDSDGYYDPQAKGFEITQKNKDLANQIKFLADTLGFKTSITEKMATIKSIGYKCLVYRVRIHGNVHIIPTKVKRKQAPIHNPNKSWRVTGIKVEKDMVDDYYGFEIDGNHLFLLEDCTVTHNTALMLALARNASVDFKRPVAVFSLEMSANQLVHRLIASETEIDGDKLRRGQIQDHEFQLINARIGALSEAPLFIDDTPALSMFEFHARAKRLKQQHDIQMIIVDYLQLMSAKNHGNREQEVSTISRTLKIIAKELNIPIIALSQLSRAVETRGGDKKPQLSDLRESGSLEQDASLVLFIHRPEYYGITEDEMGMPTRGITEIIIAKNRDGAVGSVKLKFVEQLAKFTDLEYVKHSPIPDTKQETVQNIIVPSEKWTGSNDTGEEPPF